MLLSTENQDWLRRFEKRHLRRPRVLHIGNIANNAFWNARILNEAGLDNYVVSFDYYHVMGMPEWEEADFQMRPGLHFVDDWSCVDLNGYHRPEWFIGGSRETCISRLLALRFEGPGLLRCQRFPHFKRVDAKLRAANRLRSVLSPALALPLSPGAASRTMAEITCGPVLQSALMGTLRRRSPIAWKLIKRAIQSAAALTSLAIIPVAAPLQYVARRIDRHVAAMQRFIVEQQVTSDWAKHSFPWHSEGVAVEDLLSATHDVDAWRKILPKFDAVVAYSIDGAIPYLAGVPYVCVEHGTLRHIPYESTERGRSTCLSYGCAEHVFVTNHDCAESAEKLAPGRWSYLNHPYDEDAASRTSGVAELRAKLIATLRCDFLVFFPTRHDWVEGSGYGDKANDTFVRAVAQARERGLRVGVVCCEWGTDVDATKALIDELGVADLFCWTYVLPGVQFNRFTLAADIVADQFKLGAFGGILFKALAAGSAVITYLDEQVFLGRAVSPPPVVNCHTAEQIATGLLELAREPERLTLLRAQARDWFRRYHGKSETADHQISIFRRTINET